MPEALGSKHSPNDVEVVLLISAVLRSSMKSARSHVSLDVEDNILTLMKTMRKDASTLRDGRLAEKLAELVALLVDRALQRSIPIRSMFWANSVCIMEVSIVAFFLVLPLTFFHPFISQDFDHSHRWRITCYM